MLPLRSGSERSRGEADVTDTTMKDLAIDLERDHPGEMAKAVTAIANVQVNIEGYCEVEGKLHLVVSDTASARKALETVGLSARESDAFVIDAEDRPGFLAEVLRKVSDEEINVTASYTLTKTRIALTVDQPERLKEVLRAYAPAAARGR